MCSTEINRRSMITLPSRFGYTVSIQSPPGLWDVNGRCDSQHRQQGLYYWQYFSQLELFSKSVFSVFLFDYFNLKWCRVRIFCCVFKKWDMYMILGTNWSTLFSWQNCNCYANCFRKVWYFFLASIYSFKYNGCRKGPSQMSISLRSILTCQYSENKFRILKYWEQLIVSRVSLSLAVDRHLCVSHH